jgi:hypothetical protein
VANILKRLLVHVAGFNLSLVMRLLTGKGTPRALQDLATIQIFVVIVARQLLKSRLRASIELWNRVSELQEGFLF